MIRIHELSMEELFDSITQDVGDSGYYRYFAYAFTDKGLSFNSHPESISACEASRMSREDAIEYLRHMMEEYAPTPPEHDPKIGHLHHHTKETIIPVLQNKIAIQSRRGAGNTLVDNTYLMYVGTASQDNGFLVIKDSDGLYSIGTIPESHLNITPYYLFNIKEFV